MNLAEYKLNFSLTTEQERCELITQICSQSTYTQQQYTQMADYILLANKSNKIYPEQFRSPYVIHKEQSLDELLDDPLQCNTVEISAEPISRSIYYKQKRTIDRNDIFTPELLPLWSAIDYYKQKIQQNPFDWRTKQLYVSLCQQQYTLLDAVRPPKYPLPQPREQKQYLPWDKGVPLPNGDYADIDLTNPHHMAKFLIHLPELKEYCEDLGADLAQFISDTDKALAATQLSPLQQSILKLYQEGVTYKEMQSYILQHHNRKISQSYAAVILYSQVAKKVAYEYSEIYYSRLYRYRPEKWRTCICCKQKKLLTKHNFPKLSNKPGGYGLYCKECQKKKRQN